MFFNFIYFLILKNICIYFIFRERGRKGEREGEKHQCVVASHMCPHWGPCLQPRHVSWLGSELATLWFAGRHSIHWATPAGQYFLSYMCRWPWMQKKHLIKFNIYLWLKKKNLMPWLVWLSGLSAGLQTKRSLVWCPIRAHSWVAGPGPQLGACQRQLMDVSLAHRYFSPSLSPSLPLSLKI